MKIKSKFSTYIDYHANELIFDSILNPSLQLMIAIKCLYYCSGIEWHKEIRKLYKVFSVGLISYDKMDAQCLCSLECSAQYEHSI